MKSATLPSFWEKYYLLDPTIKQQAKKAYRYDNMILATAIAAGAEAIVTGDRDLLVLQQYQAIPIVTAREFLERYFPEN